MGTPVENVAGESSRVANKKQTLFSPYIRQQVSGKLSAVVGALRVRTVGLTIFGVHEVRLRNSCKIHGPTFALASQRPHIF